MRRRELIQGSMLGIAAASWPRMGQAADQMLRQLNSPQNLATPLSYFDRLLTPEPVFFVRSHFGAPMLDRKRRLSVTGGKQALDLGLDDLKKLPQVKVTAVLQCGGNSRSFHAPRVPGVQWQHNAMGQAEWRGVRLADLLERAGAATDSGHVQLQGADIPQAPTVPKFIRSIPMARAMDPSTIVATHMNGAPLTAAHGAPMRLVVPGWTGQHWVKWLRALNVQAEEAVGFYQRTGYRMPKAPVAPGTAVLPENTVPLTSLVVRSVIGRPADGATMKRGPQEVVGVAFSGEAGIKQVEVSLDGGDSWTVARLEGEPGRGRWQVFRHRFTAEAGKSYRVASRATDVAGTTQPKAPSWNPSGYLWNAWHMVEVKVAS
jgi:sulfite oxidase